jgi:hypothetical protein
MSRKLSAATSRVATDRARRVDYERLEAPRERHPAWRLLRAANAILVLSFLGRVFVEGNP